MDSLLRLCLSYRRTFFFQHVSVWSDTTAVRKEEGSKVLSWKTPPSPAASQELSAVIGVFFSCRNPALTATYPSRNKQQPSW